MARQEEQYRGYSIIAAEIRGQPMAQIYSGRQRIGGVRFEGETLDSVLSEGRVWIDGRLAADRGAQRAGHVATPERYAEFLNTHDLTDYERAMLLAHAKSQVLTAGGLANAAGWDNFEPANRWYGTLGRKVSTYLGLELKLRRNGTPLFTSALADNAGDGGDPDNPNFQWAIHPELVQGMALAGWMDAIPDWVEAQDTRSASITDEDILKLITVDPPKVWMKGYWGWAPESWGGVGFTTKSDRDTLVREMGNGAGLVVIYGTQSNQTDKRKRGRVLGIYAIIPESGSISKFVEASRLRKARADNENALKWEHAVRAVRAWGVPVELAPSITEFADQSYDAAIGQDIAARGRRLSASEALKLLDLELDEQKVFGGSTVDPNAVGTLRDRLGNPSRGGPVTHSGFFIEPLNAPRHAYVLKMSGDPSAFLAGVKEVGEGLLIVKVGISRHPMKRCEDINRNYPRSAYSWGVLHSTFDEGLEPILPQLALSIEKRLKQRLDESAESLGGEFFLVDNHALLNAWKAAKLEYGNHQ